MNVEEVAGLPANVGTAVSGTYGSVTISSDGSYTYTLNNADADTQALYQGQVVTDQFTYTVTDECGAHTSSARARTFAVCTSAPVAVADTNANDAVVESGVNPGNTAFAGDPSATGNVLTNDTDVDTGDKIGRASCRERTASDGVAVDGTKGSIAIRAKDVRSSNHANRT